MRMPVDIIGGMASGRSLGNRQECINLYPVLDPTGNKAPKSLLSTPGSRPFIDFGTSAGVRGIHSMKGVLFSVVGSKLYRIDGTTPVELTTLESSSGVVTMEDNGDSQQVAICDNTKLYIWDETAQTISYTRAAQTMTYQNRYLIITEIDQDIIRWSMPGGDFTMWDELDFIAADAEPDKVVRVLSDNNQMWVFGSKTVEPFYLTNSDPLFQAVPNGTSDVGIAGINAAVRIDGTMFWLDDTARVRQAQGYTPAIISTDAITDIITGLPRFDDVQAMTYSGSGHEYLVLTFPTDNLTIVYDIATGVWHQWSSGIGASGHTSNAIIESGRHISNCILDYGGEELVGDYSTGKIHKLDYGYYYDGIAGDESLIKRLRTGKTIEQPTGKFIFARGVEIECRVGVGLNDGDYIEPKILYEYSKDDGQTFIGKSYKSLGKMGKWKHRVKWWLNGRARRITPRWTITDPVQIEILGAWMEAEEGTR